MNGIHEHRYFLRNPRRVAVTSAYSVLFIGEDGSTIFHPTSAARLWSDFLRTLTKPVQGGELRRVASMPDDLDEALWSQLLDSHDILQAHTPESLCDVRDGVFTDNQGFHFQLRETPACNHLLVACTGSIVSGLMPSVILSLFYSGFQRKLDLLLTRTAENFVTRTFFESYGIRTWVDPFEKQGEIHIPHVQLARSADVILVMPATAHSLQRLALGASSDLLSMTATATSAPIVVSPVMNEAMWTNSAVQRNVDCLREDGRFIIEPTLIFGAADMASGREAMVGGHGTLWAGPSSVMHVLTAVLVTVHQDLCGL